MSRASARHDRRRFLCRSSAALLAIGVHLESPAAEPRSPSEKLHLGVIGVGNRGVDNIAGVKGENLVALCDVDARYLDQMSGQFPQAETYRDFREMLLRKDLDGVVVSSPDHTHALAAATAMRRGLHVYCERPLAHDIAEVRLLARVAGETKVATQMGNQHHSSDGYRRAVQILRSGALGDTREVHAWTNRPRWPQGIDRPQEKPPVPKHLDWNLWLGPAPERPYHPAYHPQLWQGWWDFGTGAIGDFGPHILDPVYEGLQLGPPTTVSPESSPVNEETAPAWSVLRFQFPARDDLPPVQLTWYDGSKLPPREATGLDRLPPNGALLLGERGKLFIPELGRMPTVIPLDKSESIELPEPNAPPSPGHWQEWLRAAKGGPPAGSHFGYAAGLTELCLLGNVALRVGEKIQWDAEKMKIVNNKPAEAYLSREYRQGWNL